MIAQAQGLVDQVAAPGIRVGGLIKQVPATAGRVEGLMGHVRTLAGEPRVRGISPTVREGSISRFPL